MITPELETYIRQQLGAGVARDAIRKNLFAKAWDMQDVEKAFAEIEAEQSAQTTPPPAQAPATPAAQQPAQGVRQVSSRGHKGVWAIVVVILLLLGAGGVYAAYAYGLFASPAPTTTIIPVATTTTESVLPVASTTPGLATTTPSASNAISTTTATTTKK